MKSGLKQVGAYEVKTHLSSLLAEVEKGREIVVTRRGRPVARLVPFEAPVSRKEIFDRIRAFHAKMKPLPKGETTKSLIEAGRRF